jgi:prophage antirepressor
MNELISLQFEGCRCRNVIIDGARWWVGNDVCAILGYKNPRDAMQAHCKGVAKRYPLRTAGGMQELRIISEPDVFRLISSSKLPAAERFEAWIYETVLPEIYRTGAYISAAQKQVPSELYSLLERSEKSLKFLTVERERLRRENHLLLENKALREQLAQKNTPLTENEKAQIRELAAIMSISQIARTVNRSESAIRRALGREATR